MEFKGDMDGFGTCHFDPNFIANTFGFDHLVDRCRITFDSDKERAFNVHTENGIIRFERLSNRLYGFFPTKEFLEGVAKKKNMLPPQPPTPQPPTPPTSDDDSSFYSTDEDSDSDSIPPGLVSKHFDESSSEDDSDSESESPPIARRKSGNNNKTFASRADAERLVSGGSFNPTQMLRSEVVHIIDTVEENKKFFTKREVADATRARTLYHIVGCPTPRNFKYIL